MKTKMICASLAVAAMAFTSCSNSTEDSKTYGSVSIPTVEVKTFNDSVAMYQGIISGVQAFAEYNSLPEEMKKNFNKDAVIAGVKYILESDTALSFQYGMKIGQQSLSMVMEAQHYGVKLNPEIILSYFAQTFASDSLSEAELNEMGPEFESVRTRYGEKLDEAQREQEMKFQAELQKMFEKNVAAGKAFIAEKQKDPQVKTTQSGLAYKVTKLGTGAKAKKDGTAKVIYTGKHIDGTVFDSSNNQVAEFDLKQVDVAGFAEALPMFPAGSVVELYMPTELAYGENGAGMIEPGETLVFDIEIVE